jgi:hypothetical protein
MLRHSRSLHAAGRCTLLLASACLLPGSAAQAQSGGAPAEGDYKVGESQRAHAGDSQAAIGSSQSAGETPRLARFDYVRGTVTWRPDESALWARATQNLALRQGAQIRVTEGGRAEVRFEDGSLLRLGNGALLTLQSLYRDEQGAFTQFRVLSGLVTLRLQQPNSIFEVDTPLVSVTAAGPARVRIGIGDSEDLGVRLGRATVEGVQGKTTLAAGDYLVLRDADASYTLQSLPLEDSWERWNDDRDRALDGSTVSDRIITHTVVYEPVSRPAHEPKPNLLFSLLSLPIFHSYRGFHWGWGFGHGR